jgi:Tfp pilus assembly protein PilN
MSASWNLARRPFRDDRPAYAAAAVLFFVGAVLFAVNVRLYTAYRRGVSDVTAEIATLEGRQRAAEARSNEAKAALSSYRLSSMAEESRELARIVAERRFAWTVLLARLERTLPSDVGILRLQPQFDKDGQVTLDLQLAGRSREAVVPTLSVLAKDPAFAQVELRSESQPEGTTAEPFQFQLVSHYSPEAAAEPAPHAAARSEKSAERRAAEKPAERKKTATGAGTAAPPGRAAASAPTPVPNPLLARVPTSRKPAPRGPLNPAPRTRPPSASEVIE